MKWSCAIGTRRRGVTVRLQAVTRINKPVGEHPVPLGIPARLPGVTDELLACTALLGKARRHLKDLAVWCPRCARGLETLLCPLLPPVRRFDAVRGAYRTPCAPFPVPTALLPKDCES